ncbi:MAG TPA: CorA family divalent cation transporter, partial [Candidatus Paceibacterota bacterium]
MTKIYHKNIKDKKLEILNSFRIGSWIYVENPIEEELDSLSKEFKLDRSLLKDAIDVYEVPRMETEGKNIYIFSRFPYSEGGQTLTAPILLVMGEDFLMTVSLKKLPFLDRFTEEKIDFYTTQKTKLFLQLFSHINSSYNSFLNEINKKTRGLSIKADNIRNRDIIQFVSFEEIINDFLSSLVPTNNLLQNLLSGRSLKLYEDDKD